MKIAFDIRPFLKKETGVGIYLKNLLFNLSKIDKTNEYLLFTSSLKDRFPKHKLPDFEHISFKDLPIPVSILNYLWYKMKFPPLGLFFLKKIDLIHSPSPTLIPGGRKQIITVHDTCFIDQPSLVIKDAINYFKKSFKKAIKKADGIIAVSQFTKNRIIDIVGNFCETKTKVIYHGSDLHQIKKEKTNFKVPKNFLLSVATVEPRKNIIMLIKAFKIIKNKHKSLFLIIAGKHGKNNQTIMDLIYKNNLGDNIIFSDYIPRNHLKYLYENARLVVFPSLYEGFGLPILEAAYTSTPVVASDLPVFKEIFDDFPLYCNPYKPEDIADKTICLLDNKDLFNEKKMKAKIIENNYTWEKSAQKTLSFYRQL